MDLDPDMLRIQQLAEVLSFCLLICSEASEEAKASESPLIIVTGYHLGREKEAAVLEVWHWKGEKNLFWPLLLADLKSEPEHES